MDLDWQDDKIMWASEYGVAIWRQKTEEGFRRFIVRNRQVQRATNGRSWRALLPVARIEDLINKREAEAQKKQDLRP